MTDETTRLRDALLDDITYPARFDALPPDRCGDLAARLDALIAAAAAEARAGLVGVEAVREAAHWLERSQREQNVHQFRHGMALLRAALAGPTPSPAVERLDVQEVLDVLGAHEGNGCCDPKTLEHVAQDIHGLADAADILAALAAVRAETLAGAGVVEVCEQVSEGWPCGQTRDRHDGAYISHPYQPATPPTPVLTAARCGYLIRMLGLTPFICNRAEDDALHRSRTHPDAHAFLATPDPEATDG